MKCSCVDFLKHHKCKHMIGIAARLKYTTIPIEAKSVPLGAKRKRGRPGKTKSALQLQPNETLANDSSSSVEEDEEVVVEPKPKRKKAVVQEEQKQLQEVATKRRPGRPRKVKELTPSPTIIKSKSKKSKK